MTGAAPHALVVGATGMLSRVVLHLAGKGFTVSAVARRQAPLSALVRETSVGKLPGPVEPLALDYADDSRLRDGIGDAITAHGPLSLAVVWIRPDAPKALDTIVALADSVGGEAAPARCRFFRILGSAAADPALNRSRASSRYARVEGLDYREILLGFRIEGATSRWNTNEEIAAGVIEAIDGDRADHVVGVVRPWDMNPRLRAD